MFKKFPPHTPLILGLGSGVALFTLTSLFLFHPKILAWLDRNSASLPSQDPNQPSAVVDSASLPQTERDVKLKDVADANAPSLNRRRAAISWPWIY
jgi:soluble lytic murein transglycosylase